MIPPFHREIAVQRQRELAEQAERRRVVGTPRRPLPRRER